MTVMDRILIQHYQSPCGELILGSFGDKLCMCDWVDEKRRGIIDKRMQDGLHAGYETGSSEVMAQAVTQLDEYFAGKRTTFSVPLLFVGTEFQKSVWHELLNIPYGTTDRMENCPGSWVIPRLSVPWRHRMGRILFPYLCLATVSSAVIGS